MEAAMVESRSWAADRFLYAAKISAAVVRSGSRLLPPRTVAQLLGFVMALVAVFFAAGSGAANASEKRVALVIGNSNYRNTAALTNPANDAEDMATVLRHIGFEVVDGRDLDKRGMDAALARFARLARDADAALFFYAGHGLQFQGQNYLVPVDARLEDEFALQFETTRVEDVLRSLALARGVRLLILDACRNNPLADRLARAQTRDIQRGLAKLEGQRGMLIAYATQANDVAYDGTGRNSFFSGALVREIGVPGLEVGSLFRRVAHSVNQATHGRQTPELSLSLFTEFYLNPAETDVQAWTRLRESNDTDELRNFIARFPASFLEQDEQRRMVDEVRLRNEAEEKAALARQQAEQARQSQARAEQQRREQEAARRQSEQDRLIAERLARLEEQAFRAAEEARKQAEAERERLAQAEAERQRQAALLEAERKRVAEEIAKLQREKAEAARRQHAAQSNPGRASTSHVASLPEAQPHDPGAKANAGGSLVLPASPPGAVAVSPAMPLIRSVQRELERVGCFKGKIDEKWGSPATAEAVRKFSRYARVEVPDLPSPDFLKAIKERDGRVCPLTCGPRQILRNGACVAAPKPKPEPKKLVSRKPASAPARAETSRARAPRPAQGGRSGGCFSFGGQSFCE
jgi:hypothetical protein